MARRFQFRLQPILRLREALEKEAQRHLARMMSHQRDCEAALDALVAARTAAFAQREVPAGRLVDLDIWRATERYLVVLDRRIVAAEGVLAQAIQRVLEARQALVRAHVHHLSMLRLKERRVAQHQLEAQREEAKETDDMTVLRFRRAHPVPRRSA